ncbi:MAG: hypothetical protein ACI9VT_004052, partial [Psychroserpens sp.]
HILNFFSFFAHCFLPVKTKSISQGEKNEDCRR